MEEYIDPDDDDVNIPLDESGVACCGPSEEIDHACVKMGNE